MLQVFDRPQCCSSGVCGPEVDPVLVTFAADLEWLTREGVAVERINPVQQPEAFAANALVREELEKHGVDCLPLMVLDRAVVSRGTFPNRSQLAAWTGVAIGRPADLPVLKSGCCGGTGNGSDSCC